MNIIIVFIGGGIGVLCRYGLNTLLIPTINYWGTFIINMLGSFLIGTISSLALNYPSSIPHNIKLLIITGFLGGFTTFSSWQLELLILMKNGLYLQCILYGIISLIGGFLSVSLGFYTIHLINTY